MPSNTGPKNDQKPCFCHAPSRGRTAVSILAKNPPICPLKSCRRQHAPQVVLQRFRELLQRIDHVLQVGVLVQQRLDVRFTCVRPSTKLVALVTLYLSVLRDCRNLWCQFCTWSLGLHQVTLPPFSPDLDLGLCVGRESRFELLHSRGSSA